MYTIKHKDGIIKALEVSQDEKYIDYTTKYVKGSIRKDEVIKVFETDNESNVFYKKGKPTLEEVREYFKDAKLVESRIGGFIDLEDLDERGIHYFDGCYFANPSQGINNVLVWESHSGYAEILEYKSKQKPMKKVIRLDEPKEESKKPIELTHRIGSSRWERYEGMSNAVDKIIYLGSDKDNGDMFAVYGNGYIDIAKGYLNDGVY